MTLVPASRESEVLREPFPSTTSAPTLTSMLMALIASIERDDPQRLQGEMQRAKTERRLNHNGYAPLASKYSALAAELAVFAGKTANVVGPSGGEDAVTAFKSSLGVLRDSVDSALDTYVALSDDLQTYQFLASRAASGHPTNAHEDVDRPWADDEGEHAQVLSDLAAAGDALNEAEAAAVDTFGHVNEGEEDEIPDGLDVVCSNYSFVFTPAAR